MSNHRYDTANYLHIDPMLGTDEDFTELCDAAHACGIGIILDGVFNHTGDDSVYFNRYGNYPEPGAFQKTGSPWDDAYHMNPDGTYECWWGVANMPNLNEDSLPSESSCSEKTGSSGTGCAREQTAGVSMWPMS